MRAHCQQGGLCLVVGEPGAGKTTIRCALQNHDPKNLVTPTVGRTLHTYHNIIRILCQAFAIEFEGLNFKVEQQLIDQARTLHRTGKMLAVLIDDAHLMPMDCPRNCGCSSGSFRSTTTLSSSAASRCCARCASP